MAHEEVETGFGRPDPDRTTRPGLSESEEGTAGVQRLLAELGLDPGPVDGVLGPRTKAAIEAFQRREGMVVDGRVSDDLRSRLTAARDAANVRRAGPPLATAPEGVSAAHVPSGGASRPEDLAHLSPAALAGQVRAGDDGALVALRTALVLSGLPVLDDAGQPVVVDGHTGSGPPLAAWEVRLLAANAASAAGMRLADLGYALQGLPELSAAPVAELLLQDIRASAESPSPELRFWARFLAALGGQEAEPGDLLAAASPNEVLLNNLQLQLILRRLVSELALEGQVGGSDHGTLLPARPAAVAATGAQADAWPYGRAKPGASLGLITAVAEAAPVSGSPWCPFTDVENWVVIGGEEVISRGFKKLLRYLKAHGMEGAKMYLTALKWAGLRDYARFLIVYLSLDVGMSLNPEPLPRTQDRHRNGQQGRLTAAVRFNVGKSAAVNCLRLVLAHAGITFSLPNDGPARGVGVNWVGLGGFQAYSRGTVLRPIVRFSGGNPANQVTDESGRATIGVEGLAQERDVQKNARPVIKRATVRVLVQVKPADIWRDLLDTYKTVESTPEKPVNPLNVAIKLPLELLYRTRWLKPVDYTFAVRDWGARDYKADRTEIKHGWVWTNYTLKCNGPAGEWVYRQTIKAPGQWEAEQEWKFYLDEMTQTGRYVAYSRWIFQGGGTADYNEQGTVALVQDKNGPRLEFRWDPGTLVTSTIPGAGTYAHTIAPEKDLPVYSRELEEGEFCSK